MSIQAVALLRVRSGYPCVKIRYCIKMTGND